MQIKKSDIWKYAAFIIAAAIIVVAFVMFVGNKNPTGGAVNNSDAALYEADDYFLGPADAKIVVVEFSDFQCPYCGAAAGTHETLIQRFKSQDPSWEASEPKLMELAKQGNIKFVFRHFPLSGHPYAQKAAEAAEAAGAQGKFWEMHDKMFENQNALDVDSLKQYAADLGLDTQKFNEDLDSGKYADAVKKDLGDGEKVGVQGTPAFFVNGKLISGAQPFSAFEKYLK
jgi:protein-disulfide isomerase